jgi:hypothetical protein
MLIVVGRRHGIGRRGLGALTGVLAVALGGCVQVAPHQRATLARPDMQLGGDAELRYGPEHAQAYREGSSGGGAAKAGGCGCG